MVHLWHHGFEESHAETIAKMPEPRPTMNKFTSTLRRLSLKQFIRGTQSIRPGIRGYTIGMPMDLYQRIMTGRLVHGLFERNYKELLTFIIEQKKLTAGDIAEVLVSIKGDD